MVGIVGAQAVFYVGNDLVGGMHQDGCDYDKLQDAINYALAHYDTVEFHVRTDYAVTRSGSITIPGNSSLRTITIAGGYDHCPDPSPTPGHRSELDGFSGSGPPVLAISGHTSLTLTNLLIAAGTSTGNGGGISYNNSGCTDDLPCVLSLRDVQVTGNTANQGGGIFVNGGGTTVLKLLDNTVIDHNLSHHDGGGIFIQGDTRLFALQPGTTIFTNTADPVNNGRGGGLWLQGNARADISSPGQTGGAAVIQDNTAITGGGIGAGDAAVVRLFTTVPSNPPRIEHNHGGGVFLASASGQNALCAFGYGINHNLGRAITADPNTAGVFLLQSDLAPSESNAFLCGPEPASEWGAVACPVGKPCNTIDNNNASGPVIFVFSYLNAEQVEIIGNQGGTLLDTAVVDRPTTLTNCLIAGNTTSQQLIYFYAPLTVDSCTIASNSIGVVDVLYPVDTTKSALSLQRSIVWQPQNETLRPDIHGLATLVDVIASDAAALSAGPAFASFDNVQGPDPQFIDAAGGDFQLKDSSPAIDYARSVTIAVDLNGQSRSQDLKGTGTPYDAGAFERQGLFPSYETFDEFEYGRGLAQLGWSSLNVFGVGPGWSLTGVSPESAPFAAYAPDQPNVSENDLVTPTFHVIANARLTFHHTFQLEATYDAAVLDITMDGLGSRRGIVLAGGHFISGGYNGTLVRGGGDTPNPLGIGRHVWTGSILPSYQEVIVDLPAAANGKDVQLTWRVGSDINQGGAGYWLDDIRLDLDRPPPDVIHVDGFEYIN